MKDELKPCPFCGGEPYDFYTDNFGYWYIMCKNCQAKYTQERENKRKKSGIGE